MTTTTMYLTQRAGDGRPDARRRMPVARPIVDLAPWLAPLAWMTALALFVGGIGAVALMRDAVPSAASATIGVRVSATDTLWSIARANRLPGASTAATVEAITRANDLHGTVLSPGMVLRVPAMAAADTAFAQADTGAVAR